MLNSNFIKKIFDKGREDIKLEDLQEFFSSPQEETSILEFKSGGVEIIDIFKEVAAFLNTEGGLLIIGTPKEKKENKGKNEKVICQGDLTYSNFKNKDWIYQKIASNITPSPTYIKIVEFIVEQGAIFLIDVPQSLNPPHQSTADGKYYIRLEREAKPAPHGIVQALFDKRRVPKLNATTFTKTLNEEYDEIYISIKNESSIPADKVSFIIEIYNIEDVECDYPFIQFHEENKFTLSKETEQILVQVISIPIKAKIRHKHEEYIVMIGYWCRDLNFDCKFGTYCPIKKIFTFKDSKIENMHLIGKELDRIENNLSQKKLNN